MVVGACPSCSEGNGYFRFYFWFRHFHFHLLTACAETVKGHLPLQMKPDVSGFCMYLCECRLFLRVGTDLKEPLKSERGDEGHSRLLGSVPRSTIVSSHVFMYYYGNFSFFPFGLSFLHCS